MPIIFLVLLKVIYSLKFYQHIQLYGPTLTGGASPFTRAEKNDL
jgi:hypothetical protein